MKIAVMGTGGVGGYYGGLLARDGNDVTFIARGSHLKAIQANGLRVFSIHGDFSIDPAQVTADPNEIGPVELILFSVKTVHTDQAAKTLLPIIGPQTTVLSLQNGIDAAERIGAIVGMEHVVGGVTYISSVIEEPGVIRQFSQFRRIVLGELDGEQTQRVLTIHNTLSRTGITAELTDNIKKFLWSKYIFISAISGLGSLTRLEVGDYRQVPETRALLEGLMHEVEALARAGGVTLDREVVKQSLATIDSLAPHIKASMQRDVENGRPSELESMIGVIGQVGRAIGVPTPIADMIYAVLLPIDLKARDYLNDTGLDRLN